MPMPFRSSFASLAAVLLLGCGHVVYQAPNKGCKPFDFRHPPRCPAPGGTAETNGEQVAIHLTGEPTPGPAPGGRYVAVEVKRRAGIDAVEQLARYLERLNLDPMLRPVRGVLAAQAIAPQARVMAEARGIHCVVVDYDVLRGAAEPELRLF